MSTMTARERLTAATERRSTPTLIDVLRTLDAIDKRTAEEQIVYGTVCDVLTARFPAAESLMALWFADETEAGIEFICAHSYGDLMMLALDKAGAL